MTGEVLGIDHINLVVADLEGMANFYTCLLDCRQLRRTRLEGAWIEEVVGLQGVSAEVIYLAPPGERPGIELLCYQSPCGVRPAGLSAPNTPGLRHVAFRVRDIQGCHARLRAAGVAGVAAPIKVPAAAVRHDAGQKWICYLHDPEGNLIELAEYVTQS